MLNIQDILMYVHKGVKTKDVRFVVTDDEHILDTKTGVEFHLYDDGCKITYGDDLVAKKDYFTKDEQAVLFEIKKLITDPAVVAKKIANWPAMVKESREVFSGLYETPQPLEELGPVLEENTTRYTG